MSDPAATSPRLAARLLALGLAVAPLGCKTESTLYNGCDTSADCSAPTAVCDVDLSQTCVQCTPDEPAACAALNQACVGTTCQACTLHEQCPASNVCLPDGACGDASTVAYVDATGTGTACTQAMPCATLAAGVATGQPVIKMATGVVADSATTVIDGKTVTILADPGAILSRSVSAGVILDVRDSADVRIYDLEISGQTGMNDAAVTLTPDVNSPRLTLHRVAIRDNRGRGIAAAGGTIDVSLSTFLDNASAAVALSNGALTIARSTFTNNGLAVLTFNSTLTVSRSAFTGNAVGVEFNGAGQAVPRFEIVGNVFVDNGGGGPGVPSSFGALRVEIDSASTRDPAARLEFNSFVGNRSIDAFGNALQCDVDGFTARNNIMSDNVTATNLAQIGGACLHAYSIMRPGPVPLGSNTADDPLFVNPALGDLHLMPTSPARGAADPAADLGGVAAIDIDGDPRVLPADIGADEAP